MTAIRGYDMDSTYSLEFRRVLHGHAELYLLHSIDCTQFLEIAVDD